MFTSETTFTRTIESGRIWVTAARHNLPLWWVMATNILWWIVLPHDRFVDSDTVPGAAGLTARYLHILEEFDALTASGRPAPRFGEIEPGQARLSSSGGWRTLILRLYGNDVAGNRQLCPKTAALIDEIPGIRTAMFSILEPGVRLPGHGGAYKGVWRYQLALHVPPGEVAGITVGGVTRHWTQGEALTFDDTYWHTAWNDGEVDRVVLFVDIERQMPRVWMNRFNRAVLRRIERHHRLRDAATRAEEMSRTSAPTGSSPLVVRLGMK